MRVVTNEEKPVIDLSETEVKAKLAEARAKRVQACGEKLEALLAEHRCELRAEPGITGDGRISARVLLTAKEG